MTYLQYPELRIPVLQKAYRMGLFPMADGQDVNDLIYWYQPELRAVIPLDQFHVPRRLGRLIRQAPYRIAWNDDFHAVMTACGRRPNGSWINPIMIEAYTAWARAGDAFCLSLFKDETRIAGIYGVLRGGVFVAESMFSRRANASSLALVVLVVGLAQGGVALLDLQYSNAHTMKFGVVEIPQADYVAQLQLNGKMSVYRRIISPGTLPLRSRNP